MSDLPDPIETENAVDAMERLYPSVLAAYRKAFDTRTINLVTFAELCIEFMKSPLADREAADEAIRHAQKRPDGLESGLALEMWQKETEAICARLMAEETFPGFPETCELHEGHKGEWHCAKLDPETEHYSIRWNDEERRERQIVQLHTKHPGYNVKIVL